MAAPGEYVSAGKPVEREPSSVRRWYLLGNLIGTQAVPVDKENPSWHLVVRACFNVSSCAERRGLSGFPRQCSFSSEREQPDATKEPTAISVLIST